jgi:hypothetical protein
MAQLAPVAKLGSDLGFKSCMGLHQTLMFHRGTADTDSIYESSNPGSFFDVHGAAFSKLDEQTVTRDGAPCDSGVRLQIEAIQRNCAPASVHVLSHRPTVDESPCDIRPKLDTNETSHRQVVEMLPTTPVRPLGVCAILANRTVASATGCDGSTVGAHSAKVVDSSFVSCPCLCVNVHSEMSCTQVPTAQ